MAMNKNKLFLIVCLFEMISSFQAQTKHWVKFANKNGTPYTIGNPSAFLSPAAIARRNTYAVPIHFTDLPVTPSYVTQLDAVTNVSILYVSKWLNGAVISISSNSATAMASINSLTFVTSTSLVNKYKLDIPKFEEPPFIPNQDMRSASSATFNYGGSNWQTQQLNLACLHSQGFRGQGMVIAVLDAGFKDANTNPVYDSLFNRGGVLGTRDFVSGGTNVYDDDAHGEMVLSCMAAIKPGVIMGSAPRADYWLLRTEDANTEKLIEEYNWIRGAEFALSLIHI